MIGVRHALGIGSALVALALTFSLATAVRAADGVAGAAPPGPVANVWIDVDGGSCVRRQAAGPYADGQACSSLQAAANAAGSGDVVRIRDGRYSGQQLSGTKKVTFAAAGPGRPSFGQLITSAANTTMRHLLFENRDPPTGSLVCSYFDYTLFACGPNQVYDDVVVDALHKGSGNPERRGGLQVEGGATRLVFRNGEIRGVWDSKGFQGGSVGMLVENTLFHDIRLTPAGEAAGVHNECAYVTGGDGQTWRRNRFMYCPVMAMFFANYLGGPPFSQVTVENNLFTHALNSEGAWHNGSSFVIPNGAGGQNQVNGWIVRYNTFEVPPSFGRTPGSGDDNGSAQFYGNLGADGDCGVPEWTYRNNVGETCGGAGEVRVRNATNDSRRPNQAPFYMNAPGGDFRLRPGSAALNRGDPGRYPATDADGANRPLRSRPDAGAYELGTGILAVGGRGGALKAALSRFARANGADLLLTLGTGSPKPPGAGMALAGLHGAAAHSLRRARDVEVVAVDAAVTPAQTAWLRQTLSRPATVPRVIVLRHGPLGCAADARSAKVRAAWLPLF